MSAHAFSLTCPDPEATSQAARHLAARLAPGDCVLLVGDVGAGKTHFARAAIQAMLRQPEDVPSPTYTLVQTYQGSGGEIWHADLYRLADISELEELGLREAFAGAISFVEWPERLGGLAPADALTIEFRAPGPQDVRELVFSYVVAKWRDKLAEVANG